MNAKIDESYYQVAMHKKLAKKYGASFNDCKNSILRQFNDLKEAEEYIFYQVSVVASNNLVRYLPIEDYQKGYCNKEKNVIYISDWALMHSSDDVLKEIILHELIHCNFPDYSEIEVVEETARRMAKLQNSMSKLLNCGGIKNS